jgi:hypothetical protein
MRIGRGLLLGAGILALLLSCEAAAAQINTAPRISPIRIEPTRPSGMPGAAREIAPAKSEYLMIVPSEEPRVSAAKKKKK